MRHQRQFEEENGKLNKLVADLSLDRAMLQDVLAKKLARHRARTVYGWLPLGKALATFWLSVGRGHVCGV